MMRFYHNPRCRKSRETLEILRQNNIEPEIRLYLNDVPTKEELKDVLKKLSISAFDLIRKNEKIYKEQFKGNELSEDEWVEAMIAHPKLIERPIVIKGEKAILGRPPENVLELL